MRCLRSMVSRKGRVLVSNYLLALVIFTFFIVGGVSMYGSLGEGNPTMLNSTKYDEFNATFNKVDDLTTGVGSLKSGITAADTDFGAFGVLNAIISSAWNSLKLLFTSFGFVETMLVGLTSIFGVPSWVVGLAILLITLVIVFAIYSAIFQTDA